MFRIINIIELIFPLPTTIQHYHGLSVHRESNNIGPTVCKMQVLFTMYFKSETLLMETRLSPGGVALRHGTSESSTSQH